MNRFPLVVATALAVAAPAPSAPAAPAAPAAQHFRFELSVAELAHTTFSLAAGPDGRLVAGTLLVAGTPVDSCVTVSTGSASCAGLGASTPEVVLGNSLVIEGSALSLSNPGGASVDFRWTTPFDSGIHSLSCSWAPVGGLAGVVVNGACTANADVPAPGSSASGVVFGRQVATGVLTHSVLLD